MKVIFFFLLISISLRAEEPPATTETKVESFSIEEKVGQILLLGFSGKDMNANLEERLQKIKPGGLIFFKRNLSANPKKFIKDVQAYNNKVSKLPLFAALDQEGGSVVRIQTSPPLPSALALGRSQHPKNIFSIGTYVGSQLHNFGFNLNLAPVLDIIDPVQKSFIGNRSFGLNPDRVSMTALEFARGLQAEGVLSTAKHFPGHDKSESDSHVELPINNIDRETLISQNVLPYKRLIDEKAISAVMVAHVSYPKIDETYPATFSKKIIDILKDDLKFPGIILTDDIQMTGASIFSSVSERAIQAFLAGNDMVMIAWSFSDQLEAYNGLVDAVKSGRIPESRLDESFNKILSYKKRFSVPSTTRALSATPDFQFKQSVDDLNSDIFQQEEARYNDLTDFFDEDTPVHVFSSDRGFLNQFRIENTFENSKYMLLTKNVSADKILTSLGTQKKFLGVYYVTGPQSAALLNKLPLFVKQAMVVINTVYPGIIPHKEHYRAVFEIPMRNNKTATLLAQWLKRSRSFSSVTPEL